MFRIVIPVSILMISVCAYTSFKVFTQARQVMVQAGSLQDKISAKNVQINELSELGDMPMNDVLFYYKRFRQEVDIWGGFYDLKNTIGVLDLMGSGPIGSAIKDSAWEGVKQLTIKLSFMGNFEKVHYLKILGFLEMVHKKYPVDIISIVQTPKNLETKIRFYGSDNQL